LRKARSAAGFTRMAILLSAGTGRLDKMGLNDKEKAPEYGLMYYRMVWAVHVGEVLYMFVNAIPPTPLLQGGQKSSA
jgi:hypothetical protein